ncbi:succinate dehydrogenase cytochrome b556 subunit C [Legionella birminghamensis]|uniref:Succinate dehydrogenase cytochrome b556 subunit n=1 Tax=Legionella birminghamensis TaxID=28083 RepID=A0A378I6B3_9GAMM|nr:succinate dehydrogenase, cytochrome b556 subunit [Legionella birminghamensis]KTC70190.1 succinate dehydrogenase cytochrome b556 subunit C [Legionella birminghamensis]STX30402.1 succinate dehydrogenase cytochrome b556 subunit C [Legionella birminghamensis]
MKQKRPINLDLGSLKYPPMAIASILHRISGILLFVLMPVAFYFIDLSLRNEESFRRAGEMMAHPFSKLVLWGLGAALIYHLLAGIRHMLMDLGIGEHLESGRRGAILVIAAAIIFSLLLGICIW